MTHDNGAALATSGLTDRQILQRIDLNKKAGYGLEKASSATLNIIFLVCQKFGLLPGDDITLYEGKPWITLDGRVKLMRRHKEYRGYSARPLSKTEKEEWGYEPDDVVVECTIRTDRWGEIAARGKVTRAEIEGRQQRGNPVAKIHPVEMAEKRAISRAERLAFGTDALLDEDDAEDLARQVVVERTDPERQALNAAHYTRIIGTDEDWDRAADPPASPAADKPAVDGSMVTSKKDPLWVAWSGAVAQAEAEGIETTNLALPIADDVLVASTQSLIEMVEAKRGQAKT